MTAPGDTPTTCNGCGRQFPRRGMTGIGSNSRMTWLCSECVLGGKVDDVFRGIRRMIDSAIAVAQHESEMK